MVRQAAPAADEAHAGKFAIAVNAAVSVTRGAALMEGVMAEP